MAIKITHDANAATASVELTITQPLDDFDLTEVAAPIPRDIDPILASQGFKDLLDEARAILEREFVGQQSFNRATHRRHLQGRCRLPSRNLARRA